MRGDNHLLAFLDRIRLMMRRVERAEAERPEPATEVVVAPVDQGTRPRGLEHAMNFKQGGQRPIEVVEPAGAEDAIEGFVAERQGFARD